ncbi:sulfurtransferase TusA family protein [Necropsobacter massiliensis]|uniref:sulfurtransferase TusA family protein n=1 Tax=Necropsobacter massiliensis TaxID=1400001 RepID=UPI000509FF0A|nr:sulfurtransferase TusA family protein [Necropsobacter massiliensis]
MTEYALDLTEFSCPIPLLRTKRALAQLHPQDILYLHLNLFSSIDDFQLLCRQTGWRLIRIEQFPTYQRLVIGK